jgi:hypothetical protein
MHHRKLMCVCCMPGTLCRLCCLFGMFGNCHDRFTLAVAAGSAGAKVGALAITAGNRQLLRSAYTRRRPEELAVLTRWGALHYICDSFSVSDARQAPSESACHC